MLSLMDGRIHSTQRWGDHELRAMTLGMMLKTRNALTERLACLNTTLAGGPVVPPFTIAQLSLKHGAWMYREYCRERGEETTLGNAVVVQMVAASGLYPFEVHAKLLEINPVVFLENLEDALSIYIALKSSLREVVHALGGILEGEEHLNRSEDYEPTSRLPQPAVAPVTPNQVQPMTYQEYCATQDEMNARTNSAVRSLSALSGCRMDNVHAALLRVNPDVMLQDGDVVLRVGESLRQVLNELDKK